MFSLSRSFSFSPVPFYTLSHTLSRQEKHAQSTLKTRVRNVELLWEEKKGVDIMVRLAG
jgi:NAD dependent epimerase/dehydratase family enzyme